MLKTANIGDLIRFRRSGNEIVGEVCNVKDSSVIVKISEYDAEKIQIETPVTVVSHKHYVVID